MEDALLYAYKSYKYQSNIETIGTGSFRSGISGSLTRLVDGKSFIAAGTNVTITTQSNGQIVFDVTAAGIISAVTSTIDFIPSPRSISGTREELVGSIYLPTIRTFNNALALMGSTNANDSGTLKISSFNNGSVILFLTSSPGTISSSPSTSSVPFPAIGWYDILISNSSTSGSVVCNGMRLY